MAMNRTAKMVLGAMVAAIGLPIGSAYAANIVVNGSFESGDFTGWTQTGNSGFSGVECPGVGFAGPNDGACDAFFGPVGSVGGITQTLGTLPGRFYNID